MKKTLTAALTTALVVGAASTTFAAANPFSDVPADHWAYDAVAELADEGVIEGYGDGTYRGQNEITRYEMAQMVAKAMAKEDQVNAQQKAMIDRLAAEFSEELNNLGVRVSNLESRIDNVKWTGELQYTYDRTKKEDASDADTTNELVFRLEPEATVNDHWKVKARLDATWNAKEDKGDTGSVELKRAWAEGHYGITSVRAGLMNLLTEQGVVLDKEFSGASVTVGEGTKFAGTLSAGRLNLEKVDAAGDQPANLLGLNLNWKPTEALTLAGEYYRLSEGETWQDRNDAAVVQNIWGIGANYKFDSNVALSAGYWRNADWDNKNYVLNYRDGWNIPHYKRMDEDGNHAWNVQIDYKGAEQENARTFGLYAAYRYLGDGVALAPTFDGAGFGQKGWEVGGQYTFAKNIVGSMVYFNGKTIGKTNQDGVNKFFTRIEYFF